ncbi:LPS translocon maturation chaperone LptM [Variovorax sp. ZT4R33]|uniref:LPS translocon maturation chaperone LptM n=1 Tax=Variovorax sp. ZT4R33 TaxID=3443743 RepID=UPI003F48BD7C
MSTLGLCAIGVGLAGCGLKGPLYLPTVPEAADRATLPSLLVPSVRNGDGSGSAPVAPAPADAAAVPPAAPASSSPASTGGAR